MRHARTRVQCPDTRRCAITNFQTLCEDCDALHEVRCKREERGLQRCPDCGGQLTLIISGVKLIGATPSRPIDLTKQLGKSFDSNSEYRKYLAETPGVREVDKASLRPQIDAIKNSREAKAQSLGYRSERERLSEVRKKIKAEK